MIARTTSYTIDLDSATVETRWDAPLTYGDKSANIIHATLMRGSAAATLSGLTAILYGVLSDGTTAVKAGSVTGNVVTVEMDSPFYAIPGKIDLLLQLAEGTTVINTPLRITTYVKSGQTGELVSAGEEFSLAELQAIAAACESATQNATNAATAIEEMTVAASAVAPGGSPTVAISDVSSHKHIAFGIPSGLKGNTGASITSAAFSGDDIVFTKNDASTVTLEDAKPALKGDTGDPITVYRGSEITGTSTTPAVYATGITLAVKDAIYIYGGSNSADIGNEYICTLGGNATTALWAFLRNTRGVPGAGSPSNSNPAMNSTAAPGTSSAYSRSDHVHPSDTSKLGLVGGNMTGAINEALVASMALAGTMNIGAAAGNYIIVTAGTGPITAFGVAPAGARRFMRFSVAATINYNATTMLIPGAVNLNVAAGDVLEWVSGGGGVWWCVNIERWARSQAQTGTLPTSGWSGSGPYTYAASVTGVTAGNVVLAGPAPASKTAYEDCGAYPSAQGTGTLTFTAESVPTSAITVNVVALNL